VVDEHTELRERAGGDAQESRRRAFDALEDLLRNLSARRPLVLHLDDLQWGDADSARLMASLLAPPDPPRLLLLCSYRSEEADTTESFRALSPETAARGGGDVVTVDVDRLSPEESAALAGALLTAAGRDRAGLSDLAATLAREADGSPFFVAELA